MFLVKFSVLIREKTNEVVALTEIQNRKDQVSILNSGYISVLQSFINEFLNTYNQIISLGEQYITESEDEISRKMNVIMNDFIDKAKEIYNKYEAINNNNMTIDDIKNLLLEIYSVKYDFDDIVSSFNIFMEINNIQQKK